MLTITITPRAVVLAALLTLAGVLAFYASDALGSSQPDAYIQGDTNCDGVVDSQDALNDLRYTADLDIAPFPDCPQIGTEAAIPGPQGDPGPQGEPGPQGPPGVNLFAKVKSDGTLVGGNATSVTYPSTFSSYEVVFGQDVSECAATAVPGSLTGDAYYPAAFASVNMAVESDNSINVFFNTHTGDIYQTDFHLIVVC